MIDTPWDVAGFDYAGLLWARSARYARRALATTAGLARDVAWSRARIMFAKVTEFPTLGWCERAIWIAARSTAGPATVTASVLPVSEAQPMLCRRCAGAGRRSDIGLRESGKHPQCIPCGRPSTDPAQIHIDVEGESFETIMEPLMALGDE